MTERLLELPPDRWLSLDSSRKEVRGVIEFLTARGTFQFPTVSSGLFSAAAAENPDFRLTGYQNVWARDNCHIAHALWRIGETGKSRRAVDALLAFYQKHQHRFDDIISGKISADEPMDRPHIRFDGETLDELDVRWAHAQNDALGAVLWLACRMLLAGDLEANSGTATLFDRFARYFAAINYWQDEDSGHWEETRKVEASSIGVVVAGLTALREWADSIGDKSIDRQLITQLIGQGRQALQTILPAECVQPDPRQNRRYDSALLFLIYPFDVVDDSLSRQIIGDVAEHLTGPIGIRRYLGDSYWCANYRDLLSAEARTSDFSDDLSQRDSLLKPGEEAQWCVFDPILSIIHGRRFHATGDIRERELQREHLLRSLKQLTTSASRFPAYRGPESYFLEHGEWIPNDICPLLWTQANLRLALHQFEQDAAKG